MLEMCITRKLSQRISFIVFILVNIWISTSRVQFSQDAYFQEELFSVKVISFQPDYIKQVLQVKLTFTDPQKLLVNRQGLVKYHAIIMDYKEDVEIARFGPAFFDAHTPIIELPLPQTVGQANVTKKYKLIITLETSEDLMPPSDTIFFVVPPYPKPSISSYLLVYYPLIIIIMAIFITLVIVQRYFGKLIFNKILYFRNKPINHVGTSRIDTITNQEITTENKQILKHDPPYFTVSSSRKEKYTPTEEEVLQQKQLLQIHRKTLFVYLQQQAMTGQAHLQPNVIHGIDEARDNIRKIKALLRAWNVPDQDHPNDEASL